MPFGLTRLIYILTVQCCYLLTLQSWELGQLPLLSLQSSRGGCALSKVGQSFNLHIEAMCGYSFCMFRKMMFFACFSCSCCWGINSNCMSVTLYTSSGGVSWIPVFGLCRSELLRNCGFAWQCHREVNTSCKFNFLSLWFLLFLLIS